MDQQLNSSYPWASSPKQLSKLSSYPSQQVEPSETWFITTAWETMWETCGFPNGDIHQLDEVQEVQNRRVIEGSLHLQARVTRSFNMDLAGPGRPLRFLRKQCRSGRRPCTGSPSPCAYVAVGPWFGNSGPELGPIFPIFAVFPFVSRSVSLPVFWPLSIVSQGHACVEVVHPPGCGVSEGRG